MLRQSVTAVWLCQSVRHSINNYWFSIIYDALLSRLMHNIFTFFLQYDHNDVFDISNIRYSGLYCLTKIDRRYSWFDWLRVVYVICNPKSSRLKFEHISVFLTKHVAYYFNIILMNITKSTMKKNRPLTKHVIQNAPFLWMKIFNVQ